MADVEDLVRAMSKVKYPNMRREVLFALAGLSDPEYQQRVWVDHILPTPTYYDELNLAVHILLDDTTVLSDPDSAVGPILVEGEEVERLRDLAVVFRAMIDSLGDKPDAAYLADPRWPEVVRRAGLALAAMVRADPGWTGVETVTST